ncbi:probable LRR receptor-like serine/threonine-protein kinase At3g47570 [Triticum dicoccoides]|uniref:probable LRR receptor-like serine/threonine-protein kinase At3g47570 n=1 Tax=Triticum dicoccoides TaxID=85692 RepID=UPI00188E3266|nr:probable LRR receptor-like serine/threonine-protein kinase At3g47570 [Triticum dicoccoides]
MHTNDMAPASSVHIPSPLVILLAILLLLSITLADYSTNTSRDALLCLKFHLHDSTTAMATWNHTTAPDFCTWHGVSCTGRRPRQPPLVVALDMEAEGLAGEIPPCISNLTSLVRIHLPNNNLSGKIPPELGRISGLRYLNLSFNALSGTIPLSIGTLHNLSSLDLGNNRLSGEIPSLLGSSPALESVSLPNNLLGGEIPQSLANSSSSLTILLLAQNQLQGFIPDFGKLSRLEMLDLSYNNLVGTVPRSIFNSSALYFLGLANNNLGGTLPSDMGNTLPNIEILMMSDNHFEGDIPPSLQNASGMTYIHLGNNSLTGVIPSFSSMSNLEYVMLYSNQLEAGDWTFFSSLANCTQLENLNVDTNNLRGALPEDSIANLPKSLTALTLSSNNISGIIPLEIGNMSNLSMLYLDRNIFMGPIPYTLGQLRNLVVLSLSQNEFTGEIPPSLGSLIQLEELYLQENQLSGSLPESLSSCKNLLALNISCNTIGGSISGHMLAGLNSLSWLLDLSHNQLAMSIPQEMGNLINLGSLNISHNNLTGRIPSTLGECVRLESLRLEGNLLQGTIPQSLSGLKGIQQLDFSHNNLSGTIPKFLETFTSLQYLNMSFNNLEGPVPTGGVFANKSGTFVQGNPRLCGNVAVEELPMCFASASTKKQKVVIPMMIALSALVALAFILGMFIFWLKRRYTSSERIGHSHMELKRITYGDVNKATNTFSPASLVGSGQFGTVYKGWFDAEDGTVAVKVFKLNQHGALHSFIAECKALQHIRHRNLVKVITACSTYDPVGNEFRALVFEYMSNGSLEDRLHNHQCGGLSLGAVICISVDIACALEYLHNQCIPPVVHCDLKPSNILFDNDDTARICDFGLAKLIHGCSPGGQSGTTSIVGPRGSIGYIPPEYGMGSEISIEGDIYSYGIVLLEMLTRKRPTNEEFSDGLTLPKYVEESLSRTQDMLQPSLASETGDQRADHIPNLQECNIFAMKDICALRLLKLGLLCSAESPKDRPAMHDVYGEVIEVKEAFFSMDN